MAIIVWDNGGVDSLWSTGENWVGDIFPGITDSVQFDITSVADSTCDKSVGGVDIQAAYSGTISVSSAVLLGTFAQAGGTFLGGSRAITVVSLTLTSGVFTSTSLNLVCVNDMIAASGSFFNLGIGGLVVGGLFNPAGTMNYGTGTVAIAGTSYDASGATSLDYGSSQFVFTGSEAVQTIDFGAASPHEVIISRTGGIADFVAAFAATGPIREIALANSTVRWLNAGAFSCDFIQTIGEGAFKTSNISSGAGNYQITVADLNGINRHSGWANCDIIGAFIEVDLLTGSDDGGNDVTPPFGIDFDNFPLDPINFQGFGKLHKIGPKVIFPNIYRAPHKWHAEFVPVNFFLIKNAIGEQVINAIGEDVIH